MILGSSPVRRSHSTEAAPKLTPDKRFAISTNDGNFRGHGVISLSAQMRFRENTLASGGGASGFSTTGPTAWA
jgi:hypothetical protein